MKKMRIVGWLLIVLTLMVGCMKQEKTQVEQLLSSVTETEENEQEPSNKLEIWTYYPGWEEIGEKFKEEYGEDIEITIKTFANDKYVEAYLEGLASDKGPDLIILDSAQYSQFVTLDAFEDLADAPYQASQYEKDFDPNLWELGKGFNNGKLIALPYASSPYMMYYRKDIMEKYGFPGEPEELSEFLADPTNWFKVAETLKKDEIYMCQWAMDPATIVGASMPYFDKEYNFVRNNPQYIQAIQSCNSVMQKHLAGLKDIWLPEGQEYLKNNQYAALYLGGWGTDQIKEWVPEQEGLWRVTKLPFNTNAWCNSSLMAIPANAKNKELAWKFMEGYVFGDLMPQSIGTVPSYLPKREALEAQDSSNAFLGEQQEQKIFTEVVKNANFSLMTPLDTDAQNIIVQQVSRGLNAGSTSQAIMNGINAAVKRLVDEKKELLNP